MAYNLAQFNINPFNVQGGSVKWIKAIATETVTAVIGLGLEGYIRAVANERVSNSISGAPTRFITGSGSETVGELVANGQITILLAPSLRETIVGTMDLDAEIRLPVIMQETVGAEPEIVAVVNPIAEGFETVDADIVLASETLLIAEGFELISESASLEVIEQKTCVLTLTLKPGEKLIIDADSYTVLWEKIEDGQLVTVNAIELQSGDWIDELDRDTVDISISAAAGGQNISADIIYTERYL